MKYLLIIIILLTAACTNKQEASNVSAILYGTEEFDEFEKKASIKKEEAWDILIAYYKNQGQAEFGPALYLVYDGNYVFSHHVNLKIPEVKLTGVWVDATTGKAMFVTNEEGVRPSSFDGWRKIK